MSWKGVEVRRQDGLEGKVVDAWDGFLHQGLKIRASDGSEHFVQLNANGRDTGEQGWLWLHDKTAAADHASWGVLSDRPLQPIPDGVDHDFIRGWMRAERHLQMRVLFEDIADLEPVFPECAQGYAQRISLEQEQQSSAPVLR